MLDPHTIKGVHKYAYKGKGTRGGERKMTHIGSSYELDRVVSRFMSYKLELVKSKTPKIRNQEEIREASRRTNCC